MIHPVTDGTGHTQVGAQRSPGPANTQLESEPTNLRFLSVLGARLGDLNTSRGQALRPVLRLPGILVRDLSSSPFTIITFH